MTEAERIDYLVRTLEKGSSTDFGNKIGASKAVVSRMRKGTIGIRSKIDGIIAAYPSVSRDWLNTGEGYPGDLTTDLVKAHYEHELKRAHAVIDQLLKQLKEKDETIECLQNACKQN